MALGKNKINLTDIIVMVLFIFIMVLYIYPLLQIIIVSFGANYGKIPPEIIPAQPKFSGYIEFFTNPKFARWILNSVIFSISVTFGSIALAILAGYALSRLDFPGRAALFWYVIFGIMVPGIVTYIPLFMILLRWRMINTYQGLIIPLLPSAYNAFLFKQAFDSVPKDYEEAAYIDGAGPLTIAFRIMLPIVRPVIVTTILFNFVWNWNNFAWPWFVAPKEDYYTLPLAVYLTTWSYTVDFWKYASGAVIQFIVPLAVYIAATSYFLRGIRLAGIKR